MWQVLRPLVAIWRQLNQERDKRIAESAARRTRLEMQREMQAQLRPVFGDKYPVYVPVASVQFLDSPPLPQIGTYEPPDKQTDAMRPVSGPPQQETEPYIWPIVQEALSKPLLPSLEHLTDTRNLPAVPGVLKSKAFRKLHKQE